MSAYRLTLETLRPEVVFTAVSSRGPGGQNVNKVSSAALLSWNVSYSRLLTDEERTLIFLKLANHINKEGEIIIRSDEYRDLPRNKERGLEKLLNFVLKAIFKPKPRRPTKPTRSSQRKRLEGKVRHGNIKKHRQKVGLDD